MKVQIVEIEGEEVVKEFDCITERQAERVERGVSLNLDHLHYFTRIIE